MTGWRSFGKYGSLGFELLLSMAIGYYGGLWLDKKLGTRWLALVGFLIGCYSGFRALFRAAKQMERDIENDAKLARGEDPWAPPDADEIDETASDDAASASERKGDGDGDRAP